MLCNSGAFYVRHSDGMMRLTLPSRKYDCANNEMDNF